MERFTSRNEANDFVLRHGYQNNDGQVVLTKSLTVVKKVHGQGWRWDGRDSAIATLIIPSGAVVNLAQFNREKEEYKFRASQAYCMKIFRMYDKICILNAQSMLYSTFIYTAGINDQSLLNTDDFCDIKVDHELSLIENPELAAAFQKCKVVPSSPFATITRMCASGIHFFLDMPSAIDY